MTSNAIQRLNRRGYTLIELLIVTAILGLAAAIVVPQFAGTQNMRAQAAVRLIIADLSFAQADAVAHQEYRRLWFYADGSGYCIERVTDGNYTDAHNEDTADYITDPLATGDKTGLYVVKFDEQERFNGVSTTDIDIDNGNNYVVYDQLGGTIAGGGIMGSGGDLDIIIDDSYDNEIRYRISIAPVTGKLTVDRIVEDDEEDEDEG